MVFFFYPLDFTFVCPTEIIAFRYIKILNFLLKICPLTFKFPEGFNLKLSDRADEFRKIGAEVVAASVDSHFTHLAWTKTPRKEGGLGKMNIPLVSDLTKSISRDYGVLLEDQGITLRGLFIIDPQGVVRQITINDLLVGR